MEKDSAVMLAILFCVIWGQAFGVLILYLELRRKKVKRQKAEAAKDSVK